MAVAYTLTAVNKVNVVGNRKQKVFDLTSDTGTYVTGGNAFAASLFNLKKLDFIAPLSSATGGTAGATVNEIGITYNSGNTTATVQIYESAATGLPGLEKTNGEAMVSNFTVRLLVQGY
jgi:hypothetical protein